MAHHHQSNSHQYCDDYYDWEEDICLKRINTEICEEEDLAF